MLASARRCRAEVSRAGGVEMGIDDGKLVATFDFQQLSTKPWRSSTRWPAMIHAEDHHPEPDRQLTTSLRSSATPLIQRRQWRHFAVTISSAPPRREHPLRRTGARMSGAADRGTIIAAHGRHYLADVDGAQTAMRHARQEERCGGRRHGQAENDLGQTRA